MVRAKMKVTKIESSMGTRRVIEDGKEKWMPAELRTVVLNPIYDPDPNSENGKFYASSPSGEIRLGTINPEAWSAFVLNQDYYIDFTPAN
jgi:hypothetical protein